ncbi:MAG: glucosyltransferase domain-containing protein, partial [Oscillibacter sp.]|nr:glucosyltransferase domain-containing protein [Oscillibacter sp.]
CFSHDAVSYYAYSQWGLPFYTERGRFLIPLYEACKGGAAAPWLIGLLFTLWTALASYLILRLLDIQGRAGQVLTCGLVCTNQALTLTGATYVYCMDEYALALLLAAVSAYLFQWSGRRQVRRRPNSRRAYLRKWITTEAVRAGGAAAGLLALTASLALYQPYFTVAAALCLLAVVRQAARGERLRAVILSGVRHLLLLVSGFVLYYGLWTIVCAAVGVEKQRLDSAALPQSGADGANQAGLWTLTRSANLNYLANLFRGNGVLGGLLAVVHVLLLALLLWRLVRLLTDRRLAMGNRILLVLLALLLPTAFCSVSVLIPGDDHALTAFAGELFYLLAAVSMEFRLRRRFGVRVRRLLAALLCLVLWQHVVSANQAYMKKDLEKNATIALASQIIGRIEAVEGYVPGETPVAFAGRLDTNPYLDRSRPAFAPLDTQVGLWHNFSATYNLGRYLTDYLNYPLLWDLEMRYAELDEVKAMPLYPAEGSVGIVRGTVVVKLSGPRSDG